MTTTEIILAILSAIGGPTTIGILYKWAKAQGKTEALQELAKETIMTLKAEIKQYKSRIDELTAEKAALQEDKEEIRQEKEELRAENSRLWSMLQNPQEKS